jgi:hypothetical protein
MYNDGYFGGGDVMGDADVMGAALNIASLMRGRGAAARVNPAMLRAFAMPRPGQGSPMQPDPMPPLPMGQSMPTARLRSYLGVGVLSWGATDAGLLSAQVTLQESFRPERLIIDEVKTGTPAGHTLLNQVFAGTMPQSPSIAQGTPVSMFTPNATYSAVDMQIVWRGTQLTVQASRSAAPGTNNAVSIAIGFYGQWIR